MKKLTAKTVFEMGWRASNAGVKRTLLNVEEFMNQIADVDFCDGRGKKKLHRLWRNWFKGYDASTIMAKGGF